MKKALLIHNPTAGDGQHNKNQLMEKISLLGFQVRYISTDSEDWEEQLKQSGDALFLAGGDGTFHKVVEVFLKQRKPSEKLMPIHLIALGTANNIVKTLLDASSIKRSKIPLIGVGTDFDRGLVSGIPDHEFFLESMGVGVFPELIHLMKTQNMEGLDPNQKLRISVEALLILVQKFQAEKITIKADGIRLKGRFILMELMNIRYVGPNLDLAPQADPGDGFFDLVMIPDSARSAFVSYLKKRITGVVTGEDMDSFTKTIRVKNITLKCPNSKLHVDDALIINGSRKRIRLKVDHKVFKVIA